MSKEKLKSLRNKIDSVEEKLLQLIQRRGSLAKKVGDLKKITTPKGLFYKPAREAEILRKIIKLNDGSVMPDNKVRQIFKELISVKESNATVLLSPASASYDQFNNFAERGNQFKKIIKNYAKKFL